MPNHSKPKAGRATSEAIAPFPIFDLGSFEAADAGRKAILGVEVDEICRSTGFLAVSNHGVSPAVIDAIWFKAQAFFDLPADVKLRSRGPYDGYPYGYIGIEREALARSRGVEGAPDLKESFNGGPNAPPPGLTDAEALSFCYAATPWPEEPQGFADAWRAYYEALEALAVRIMRVFAVALGLPEPYFDRVVDAPISALRALNYPARDTPPKPGQIRAGAHSDYGSRVVNSSAEQGGMERRQSLAFFHQPNWHAEISALDVGVCWADPPRYPPVRSGPYLMSKFKSTTA